MTNAYALLAFYYSNEHPREDFEVQGKLLET